MSAHISPAASSQAQSYTCFFYGTLIHPAILARILGHPDSGADFNLYVQPAILPGYNCLHVNNADYPALIKSDRLNGKYGDKGDENTDSAHTIVRGALVRGLSHDQVRLLDTFEGSDYTRQVAHVLINSRAHHPVRNDQRPKDATGLLQTFTVLGDDAVAFMLAHKEVEECHVYVWSASTDLLDLQRGTWSFETFLRERAHRWVGPGLTEDMAGQALAEDANNATASEEQQYVPEEYKAVDEARERLAQAEIEQDQQGNENEDLLAQFLGEQGRTASSTLTSMPVGADPWSAGEANFPVGSASAGASALRKKSADDTVLKETVQPTGGFASDNPWANEEEAKKEMEREAAAVRAALAAGKSSEANAGTTSTAVTPIGTFSNSNTLRAIVEKQSNPLDTQPELSAPTWGAPTPPPTVLPEGKPFGNSTRNLDAVEFGVEKLGHPAARFWGYVQGGYTNLNSGAYGTCPKPVRQAYNDIQEVVDANPDLFRVKVIYQHLVRARTRLSAMLNVPADTVALIANATTGSNAVLRDYKWQPGDKIFIFSTIFYAVERTIQYIRDTHPHPPEVIVLDVVYPLSHEALVELVESKLKELKEKGELESVKMAIFDAISSRPAVKVPWERLCKVFKQNNILSFVDAAHGIGCTPLNVGEADPDFLVSNCHKWQYAPRSCAVFYVAPRNRHIARSSLPTSHGYVDAASISPENNTWLGQWEAPGSTDFAHFCTVNAALDFRERLGGEERIMSYNRTLACEGGAAAAKILGTELLETKDWELTTAMVNVRIPLLPGTWKAKGEWMKPGDLNDYFEETMLQQFKTTIPLVEHGNKMWARFSAQVWLEKSDFEYGARALKELCRRINEGEVSFK